MTRPLAILLALTLAAAAERVRCSWSPPSPYERPVEAHGVYMLTPGGEPRLVAFRYLFGTPWPLEPSVVVEIPDEGAALVVVAFAGEEHSPPSDTLFIARPAARMEIQRSRDLRKWATIAELRVFTPQQDEDAGAYFYRLKRTEPEATP